MWDSEPVYGDYHYVADGKVIQCPRGASFVRDVKKITGAKVVQECDMVARKLKPAIRR